MSGINKALLVGHIGKEPNFRIIDNEVAVLSFPLATSEYINKNGIRVEETEWHQVILWRGLAEAGYKLLKKGKLIYVEGKVRTRNFIDKGDVKKYVTEIVADSFKFWAGKVIFMIIKTGMLQVLLLPHHKTTTCEKLKML